MQFGSVAADSTTEPRSVATGSSTKSHNIGGIVDCRFLTITGSTRSLPLLGSVVECFTYF